MPAGLDCRQVELVAHLHRHHVVANYLQQHMDKYSLALACDARDVAFQSDLFATPAALDCISNSKVLITTEDPPTGWTGANRLSILEVCCPQFVQALVPAVRTSIKQSSAAKLR